MSGAVSPAEINGIARLIVERCDQPRSGDLHVALCALLSERNTSLFDGVMALLWTAIHALQQNTTRLQDGTTLGRDDAERVLIAIMDGPELQLTPAPVAAPNAPGGVS